MKTTNTILLFQTNMTAHLDQSTWKFSCTSIAQGRLQDCGSTLVNEQTDCLQNYRDIN